MKKYKTLIGVLYTQEIILIWLLNCKHLIAY